MPSDAADITSLMAELQIGDSTKTAAASERALPTHPSAPLQPAPAVGAAKKAAKEPQSNRPLRQLLKLEDAWTFSM